MRGATIHRIIIGPERSTNETPLSPELYTVEATLRAAHGPILARWAFNGLMGSMHDMPIPIEVVPGSEADPLTLVLESDAPLNPVVEMISQHWE